MKSEEGENGVNEMLLTEDTKIIENWSGCPLD